MKYSSFGYSFIKKGSCFGDVQLLFRWHPGWIPSAAAVTEKKKHMLLSWSYFVKILWKSHPAAPGSSLLPLAGHSHELSKQALYLCECNYVKLLGYFCSLELFYSISNGKCFTFSLSIFTLQSIILPVKHIAQKMYVLFKLPHNRQLYFLLFLPYSTVLRTVWVWSHVSLTLHFISLHLFGWKKLHLYHYYEFLKCGDSNIAL